jgi:hypothetical protein
MIFACQIDIEPVWVRIFPQSGEFFSSLFRSLNIIFFIIWEYLLILPRNLEMPSIGTPKIPRFKIIFSMCECCCPFFIFCLFLAFQRKVRILTTQKSLATMHLVNFYSSDASKKAIHFHINIHDNTFPCSSSSFCHLSLFWE